MTMSKIGLVLEGGGMKCAYTAGILDAMMDNGFDLTNYDERTLAFAKDYANQLLAIDVNLDTTEMLDVTWGLFSKYFKPEEVNIKKELVDQHWKKQ